MVHDCAWGIMVKSRKNASAVVNFKCRSLFATQVLHRDSTINRFPFLLTMSSTSLDSKRSFNSEGSEICYIAEIGTKHQH